MMENDRWVDFFLIGSILLLVLLKVFGILEISWLVVFAPALIIMTIGGAALGLIFGLGFIKGIIEIIKENKKNERN